MGNTFGMKGLSAGCTLFSSSSKNSKPYFVADLSNAHSLIRKYNTWIDFSTSDANMAALKSLEWTYHGKDNQAHQGGDLFL